MTWSNHGFVSAKQPMGAIRRITVHCSYEQANEPTTHKKQTALKSAFLCDDPVSLLDDTDCIVLPSSAVTFV